MVQHMAGERRGSVSRRSGSGRHGTVRSCAMPPCLCQTTFQNKAWWEEKWFDLNPKNIRSYLDSALPSHFPTASHEEASSSSEDVAEGGRERADMPSRTILSSPAFLGFRVFFCPAPYQSPMLPFWQGIPLSAVTVRLLRNLFAVMALRSGQANPPGRGRPSVPVGPA